MKMIYDTVVFVKAIRENYVVVYGSKIPTHFLCEGGNFNTYFFLPAKLETPLPAG